MILLDYFLIAWLLSLSKTKMISLLIKLCNFRFDVVDYLLNRSNLNTVETKAKE